MYHFTLNTGGFKSGQSGRLAFDWPEDQKQMKLSVESSDSLWMTGALYDSHHRLRGQLLVLADGRTYQLGPDIQSTSPGWVAGKLEPGEWFLDYFFHAKGQVSITILPEVNPVTVSTEDNQAIYQSEKGFTPYIHQLNMQFSDQAGWKAGDLHSHTTASDGQMSVDKQIFQAQQFGLDYCFITDHNVALTSLPTQCPLPVYPGLEVTTDFGDFNLLWCQDTPFNRHTILQVLDKPSLRDFINKTSNLGILSINHPFLGEFSWYADNILLKVIDSIEIINAPAYSESNQATQLALVFWDTLLNDGHRIWGVGGSDTHKAAEIDKPNMGDGLIGDPTTWINSNSLKPEDMVAAYQAGHLKVSRHSHFHVDYGNYLPEETIDSSKAIKHIQVDIQPNENLPAQSLTIQLVVDGEVHSQTSATEATFSVPSSFYDGKYHWLRIQVVNEDKELLAFANPIFAGDKIPSLETWKDAMTAGDLQWTVPPNHKAVDH